MGGCLSRGVPGGDPPTDTAAGGTHPTGMHSCFKVQYHPYATAPRETTSSLTGMSPN